MWFEAPPLGKEAPMHVRAALGTHAVSGTGGDRRYSSLFTMRFNHLSSYLTIHR